MKLTFVGALYPISNFECISAGRELAKFMAAVQAAVYGSPEATLTSEIWNVVLSRKLYEHQERKQFRLGHHGTPGDTAGLQQPLSAVVTGKK